jgi:hypothetical protein
MYRSGSGQLIRVPSLDHGEYLGTLHLKTFNSSCQKMHGKHGHGRSWQVMARQLTNGLCLAGCAWRFTSSGLDQWGCELPPRPKFDWQHAGIYLVVTSLVAIGGSALVVTLLAGTPSLYA